MKPPIQQRPQERQEVNNAFDVILSNSASSSTSTNSNSGGTNILRKFMDLLLCSHDTQKTTKKRKVLLPPVTPSSSPSPAQQISQTACMCAIHNAPEADTARSTKVALRQSQNVEPSVNFFELLPSEILIYIAKFLSVHDLLLSVRFVNKTFYAHLSSNELLWRELCATEWKNVPQYYSILPNPPPLPQDKNWTWFAKCWVCGHALWNGEAVIGDWNGKRTTGPLSCSNNSNDTNNSTGTSNSNKSGWWFHDERGSQPHGKAISVQLDSKNVYIGEYVNGKKCGFGILVFADGRKYEGEWKDNKRHGTGVFTWGNGRKYEGEYNAGKKEGFGVFVWSDGEKYEGQWKNGRKHGKGVYTFLGGRKYEGEYKDGLLHGKGVYTYADGRHYIGEWREGRRAGIGSFVDPSS